MPHAGRGRQAAARAVVGGVAAAMSTADSSVAAPAALDVEQRRAISARIRQRARELGFDAVGLAPAHESAHAAHYARWVEAGYAGEMGYLAREDAVAKRADPALVVPGARSAVVVARSYFTAEPAGAENPPPTRRAPSSPATPATTTTTSCSRRA